MTSFSAKILDAFRNLKSDAVPKSPRPSTEQSTNDVNEENHSTDYENVYNDPEEVTEEPREPYKPKNKKNLFGTKKKPKKNEFSSGPKSERNKNGRAGVHGNNVNTQATGYVVNIIDSNKVRCGNDFVYYLGSSKGQTKPDDNAKDSDDEMVEKSNLITLLMESSVMAEHEYIDYVSKNLGRNWHSFFRKLGYSKGRIETFEIDEARNGVSEARYKLLLDWIRNSEDGTLGRLATLLWEEGERHIVKELSLIYSKNNCQ